MSRYGRTIQVTDETYQLLARERMYGETIDTTIHRLFKAMKALPKGQPKKRKRRVRS